MIGLRGVLTIQPMRDCLICVVVHQLGFVLVDATAVDGMIDRTDGDTYPLKPQVLKFEYAKPLKFKHEQPLNKLAGWATLKWYR